jgi:hypothetical protein
MEEQTKKWYQSRTIQLSVALIVTAGNSLLQQINFITSEQVQAANDAYPQIQSGISQVQNGMWYSGIATLIGVAVVYFRFKTNQKIN